MVLPVQVTSLHALAYKSLVGLASEDGIHASGKDEVFGCIFGRDSAITILQILSAHKKKPLMDLLAICKRTLLTLVALQGKEFNIESGEEPGKFIHEFRKDRYQRLINRTRPWYVYPDGKLRNYDSIDATPLTLIALYRYWQIAGDNKFLLNILPAVEAGLNWIITFGDKNKDLFIEYEFPPTRKYGGLLVQSWTDSKESLLTKEGKMPQYPIAAVEVQAVAWLALRLWSDFYLDHYPTFGKKLQAQAKAMKKKFNDAFILKDKGLYFGAQAVDGAKRQIETITGNPLLCLWAMYQQEGEMESIVQDKYIADFVHRAFQNDMFIDDAGIRTMSETSPTFNPNQDSYHNGSFWPMLNGLIVEGLQNFQFCKEATALRNATLQPLAYFNAPIELYIKKDNTYLEYRSASGQVSCRTQAWSAAALLYLTLSDLT